MAVRVSKPAFNLRDELNQLNPPIGAHGGQLMKSSSPEETFNLVGTGRRNVIINGCMRFNQRGAASYDGNNVVTLDRWKYNRSTDGEFDIKQSTVAPDGFSHSLHLDCKAADSNATPSSGVYGRLRYHIEGQDVQRFCKGKSSAKNFCLSFYVKSNTLGTYAVNLQDSTNSRIIGRTYEVKNDGWNRYTLVFPNETTNAITSNNSSGLEIQFFFVAGSNRTSGNNTQWSAWHETKNAYGHTAHADNSTSNNIYLTGVQLEVGDTATPFEHRSYGEELALCERYCQKYGDGWWFTAYHRGAGYSEYGYGMLPLRTTMRSGSITVSAQGDNLHGYRYVPGGYRTAQLGSGRTASHIVTSGTQSNQMVSVRIQWQSGHGWSNDDIVHYMSSDADTFLILSAEL